MAHDDKIQPADETTPAAQAPNPAGDVLSDDDIDAVAGGTFSESSAMMTEGAFTWGCCTATNC